MDPGLLTLLVVILLLGLLLSGLPVTFVLLLIAGVGFILIRGPSALSSMVIVAFTTITSETLIALSLFIFMASVLEVSGVGRALYDMMHKWMAGLRGGLAMGTVAISTIIAAMSGSGATATVTMGMLAYPEMEQRGYDKRMIIGCMPAGGVLGPLIPPSIVMIVVCSVSALSIGKLFIAGIFPGFITALGFMAYIGIRCQLNPAMGPPLSPEERVGWKEKFASLRLAGLPILLVFLVLGLIYLGVATPTEAGGIGAFGALLCTIIYRNFSLANLKRATDTALKIAVMLMWVLLAANAFSQLIGAMGVQGYITDLLTGLAVSRWVILGAILVITYVAGMFIDATPIAVIFLPIFFPIVSALGFDMLWFGLIFTMDLLIGLITPPFGVILFYFKGLNFPGVTIMDIYRSILPFVLIMTVVMILVVVLPQIAVWLPNMMIK